MVKKFAAALVFATLVASGVGTFGTTVQAHGRPGYCDRLSAAIADATAAGFTDFAAYLQGIYDANCL